jgi:hypothetical protein
MLHEERDRKRKNRSRSRSRSPNARGDDRDRRIDKLQGDSGRILDRDRLSDRDDHRRPREFHKPSHLRIDVSKGAFGQSLYEDSRTPRDKPSSARDSDSRKEPFRRRDGEDDGSRGQLHSAGSEGRGGGMSRYYGNLDKS